MKLRVNGQDRELPDGTTVQGLLLTMGIAHDGIAVAVDRNVVPKGQHGKTVLAEGQDVEVIRAVGGG